MTFYFETFWEGGSCPGIAEGAIAGGVPLAGVAEKYRIRV